MQKLFSYLLIASFIWLPALYPLIVDFFRNKRLKKSLFNNPEAFRLTADESVSIQLQNEVKEMIFNNGTQTLNKTNTMAKKKILLIDDEPDILEFLSYNLKKKGHTVFTANDGLEGLTLALVNSPDIVIADILMPHMNGILMCRQMKNDDRLKNIPIIFLSAVQDDYRVLASMEAGGDHYVSKPVKFELLYSIMEDVFGKKEFQFYH